LAANLSLDDFPLSNPGYGNKVTVIGVGSAGCRIAQQLSKESKLLERFLYLTCDEHDVVNVTRGERIVIDAVSSGKETPYKVRKLATSKMAEVRHLLKDTRVVFIVAGLGGSDGSGIAPMVAKEAIPKDAVTVALLVMPFSFEKAKHFFAGGALKQMRSICSGVILVDNEQLINEKLPIIDAFSLVNQRISLAVNKLLGSAEAHEFSVGLNNLIDFLKASSYSVLSLGEVNSDDIDCRQAVIEAVKQLDKVVIDSHEASRSIVHLCADKSVTMKEVISSIGGLSGMIGNGTMQMEYGLSANSPGLTTAIILATGFSMTKFDDYDPVDRILRNRGANMEAGFDCSMDVELLLPDAESD
jgi:cell division protein FtsZ